MVLIVKTVRAQSSDERAEKYTESENLEAQF